MQWVCHNGAFVPASQPLFTAANRGFKWGDGLFETARFCNGTLLLSAYHFDRLFSGLQVLQITPRFTAGKLTAAIAELCKQNACTDFARVRISIYREEDDLASYTIEAAALAHEKKRWNEQGWRLVVYPHVRKSCDAFANLKSANYLPYVMAARYAKAQGADECLVLNAHYRICDGSRTNLFLLNGNNVLTPALSEGGVAGVMRRYVIEDLKKQGYAVHEQAVTEADVQQAKQVFVTNAIEGLRWVRRFGEQEYQHGDLKKLHGALFQSLFAP